MSAESNPAVVIDNGTGYATPPLPHPPTSSVLHPHVLYTTQPPNPHPYTRTVAVAHQTHQRMTLPCSSVLRDGDFFFGGLVLKPPPSPPSPPSLFPFLPFLFPYLAWSETTSTPLDTGHHYPSTHDLETTTGGEQQRTKRTTVAATYKKGLKAFQSNLHCSQEFLFYFFNPHTHTHTLALPCTLHSCTLHSLGVLSQRQSVYVRTDNVLKK